jgi:uncharacterized membrane protein (DUF106 family)
MKISKNIFIFLVLLMSISTLSLLLNTANAAEDLVAQASISASNSGVGQDVHYTLDINNTGTSQIGSINITIPAGYSNIGNLNEIQAPVSQTWNISTQDKYIILYGSSEGLSTGQSITFSFDAKNPVAAGDYKWEIGINETTDFDGLNNPGFVLSLAYPIMITSILPAVIIIGIALGIAILNTALNRVLINYFVGWEQYRVMQKEMNEYRSETMAAARANDKKRMEKLKKKQSQINAMQAKMMKPQMVQFGISFLYIFVWIFVLTPTFGNTSLVYIPGFGPISVIYWYPIASFFLGLLSSRIVGTMPIEP